MAALGIAAWVVGAAVLLGVLLAGFYLAERPVRGAARVASVAHGVLAAAGTGLALAAGGPWVASALLLLALGGGGAIVLAQLRRRRPAGLLVTLHAAVGIGGAVLLATALAGS